ncbi:hypothetical protein LIER_18464 [Lithospermum erythrorhizon]|uniref:Uncharacterized protein n=1 Tax=Lithospermum erythrorhizon TaxID=34254 RepID=A0AAV3QGN5_LITER
MAGDEAALRPPSLEGGRALPSELGDPFNSQATSISYPNPTTQAEAPPCMASTSAIAQAPVHNSPQTTTRIPPPHTTSAQALNNPPPKTHAHLSPQTLVPAKNAAIPSAQGLVHEKPTPVLAVHATAQATTFAPIPAHAPAPSTKTLTPALIPAQSSAHVLAPAPTSEHLPALALRTAAQAPAPVLPQADHAFTPAAHVSALVLTQAAHIAHAPAP